MTLILILDFATVALLCAMAFMRGFEATLPLAAFLLILFPSESQIHLPGLFDLTTQRLIVLVLIGLYVFLGKTKSQGPREEAEVPHGLLILLLLIWMFISTMNSVVFDTSLKSVLSQLCDFFIPYYIFSKSISKTETVHKILFAFVTAVSVCAVLGAVEAYTGWSIISIFPPVAHRFAAMGDLTDRGFRVRATFAHSILFGGALAMTIPLALYLLTLAKSSSRRVFLYLSIALMFMNIYKTSSRGPWLALVFSLVSLLFFKRTQLRKYVLVILLMAVAVLIVRPGVWESISNLYTATENPDMPQGASYQWRYALYDIAYQHLGSDFSRALWGYGPESFYYLEWQGPFQGSIVIFDSCDSSIAALMIETGYIGLLIVLSILCVAVVRAFKSLRSMPEPSNQLSLVLLINICAFSFLMTNVAIFAWGQQAFMFWVIVALSAIYPKLIRAEKLAANMEPSTVAIHGAGPAQVSDSKKTFLCPVDGKKFNLFQLLVHA